MGNEHQVDIDRLLDEALARYSTAEPLAGLEQRVLQRVQVSGGRLGTVWWKLALAVSVAAAAFAVVLWMRTAPAALRVAVTPPHPPQIAAVPEVPLPVITRPARRTALPKRREFPTPAPLTPGERALLAFVANAPDEARMFHSRLDEPIQVGELKVMPLQNDDLR
jgi:hypothetical protein